MYLNDAGIGLEYRATHANCQHLSMNICHREATLFVRGQSRRLERLDETM